MSVGASAFAQRQGIPTVTPDGLICPRTLSEWKMWKERLVSSSTKPDPAEGLHNIQDTVGAIAWDSKGNLAAGVSRYASIPDGSNVKLKETAAGCC